MVEPEDLPLKRGESHYHPGPQTAPAPNPSNPPMLSTLPLLLLATIQSPSTADAVMLRYPDISSDRVVFRYDGDLWLAPREGGHASRLTSSSGTESFPKFSPDGQSVAFMASYDGSPALYTLPVTGGLPTRVTHHPDQEVLCDWHPDGEQLLYHSSAISGIRRAPKMFLTGINGGQPQDLPMAFATFGSIHTAGDWVAYTPITREFRTWRRYRGGTAQDIWLFNLQSLESKRMTDDPATDSMPMWHGDEVVFLSDRGDKGIMNLWSHDLARGELRALTDFDDSGVRFPSMGPDDVVFEHRGQLLRYEFSSGTLHPIHIEIPQDRPALRPRYHDLEDAATNHAVAPQAKRIVVEARGDIFTVPVEDGVTHNLTRSNGVAERYPSWSPDGKWIVYWSDRSGEYELTRRRSDGKPFEGSDENAEQQLTELGPGWKYAASWSPDSERLCFSLESGELYLYQLESKSLSLIDTDPLGSAIDVDWSADSSWLTWARMHSQARNGAIMLYDVANATRHEVTSGMFNDSDPTFDLSGDWLYFLSQRTFQPTYSEFDTTWVYRDSTNLMAVALRDDVESPLAPTNSEEPIADENEPDDSSEPDEESGASEDSETEDGEANEEDSGSEDEPMQVDLVGFEGRILQLPLGAGRFEDLKGLNGKVLYMAQGEGRGSASLRVYDIQEQEGAEVLASAQGYECTPSGEKLLVGAGGKVAVISPAPQQKIDEAIDLSNLGAHIDPAQEWPQLVRDVHRIFRDWFYDANMHGVDWDGVRDRALGALGQATSREDVTFLIGEMIAELNVGHAYNRPSPSEEREGPDGPKTGLLGCDWELDSGAYRIKRILGCDYDSDVRSPLSVQGLGVTAGNWLLAVNGQRVDASQSLYQAFVGCAGRETLLTLNDSPQWNGEEREVVVKPLSSERSLRYRDWVAGRRAHVEQASGGRIGYVHVPDTGRNGQNELLRQFMGQYHKDALIVDERWNGGGQIPTRFIELLNRPTTNAWARRAGLDWEWPPVSHHGPKAMLINHAAGSGGDAFPYYFRQAGLGKLIGTRTWGGLVGISGNPDLIDGGSTSVPTFGFFENDGTWGIEGHGVEPDIEVLDDPAWMLDGADPQLDRAIAHLLEELQEHAHESPTRPAPPDRSGAGITEEDK